ncbi:hypothetical protein AAC387_Pa07g2437 [Persea americana]
MRRRWLAGWAVAVEMKKMGMGRVAGQQEFGRRVAKEMMEVVKMGMGRVAGQGMTVTFMTNLVAPNDD